MADISVDTFTSLFLLILIYSVSLQTNLFSNIEIWFLFQQIEPYGSGLVSKKNSCVERKFHLQESHSVEKEGSSIRSTSGFRSMSPDYDTKEIKNIYVDCKLFVFGCLFSLSLNFKLLVIPYNLHV